MISKYIKFHYLTILIVFLLITSNIMLLRQIIDLY